MADNINISYLEKTVEFRFGDQFEETSEENVFLTVAKTDGEVILFKSWDLVEGDEDLEIPFLNLFEALESEFGGEVSSKIEGLLADPESAFLLKRPKHGDRILYCGYSHGPRYPKAV